MPKLQLPSLSGGGRVTGSVSGHRPWTEPWLLAPADGTGLHGGRAALPAIAHARFHRLSAGASHPLAWAVAHLALALTLLATLTAVGGCATATARNAVPLALIEQAEVRGLKATRFWGDEVGRHQLADLSARLPNMKAVAIADKREKGRPVVNYLALSGGGADGAFGAGVLVGWSEAGTRPRFEVVTGVSTGAIIATFAFLGPRYDDSLREVFTQYATAQLLETQLLSGTVRRRALADSAPLAGLIAKYVDQTDARGGRARSIAGAACC